MEEQFWAVLKTCKTSAICERALHSTLTEQVSGICPLRLWKSFVMSKNLERSNKRHSCVALWESRFEGSLTHTMDERSGCICLC